MCGKSIIKYVQITSTLAVCQLYLDKDRGYSVHRWFRSLSVVSSPSHSQVQLQHTIKSRHSI